MLAATAAIAPRASRVQPPPSSVGRDWTYSRGAYLWRVAYESTKRRAADNMEALRKDMKIKAAAISTKSVPIMTKVGKKDLTVLSSGADVKLTRTFPPVYDPARSVSTALQAADDTDAPRTVETADAHEEGADERDADRIPTHVALGPQSIQYPRSDANIPGEQPVHPTRSALSCVPALQIMGEQSEVVRGVTPTAGCVPGGQE
jgi:hypothetical protein